ncbi:MAG: group 1 truncated hemoglobin [Bacteriovorax sp.]|nr:group 1 truncated hemoglobin [Bacteriovorax sp.]
MDNKKLTFFDEVGGAIVIRKVHKIFYDKIYAHPWIGQFFKTIDQTIIESQQNDFMGQNFGGPSLYLGKLPVAAHKHMYINEELFELRRSLLEESLIEAKVSPENIKKWLKIDAAFKNGIMKNSIADCEKRFFTDELEIFDNPSKSKWDKAS